MNSSKNVEPGVKISDLKEVEAREQSEFDDEDFTPWQDKA